MSLEVKTTKIEEIPKIIQSARDAYKKETPFLMSQESRI
jgi:hypothetical protein